MINTAVKAQKRDGALGLRYEFAMRDELSYLLNNNTRPSSIAKTDYPKQLHGVDLQYTQISPLYEYLYNEYLTQPENSGVDPKDILVYVHDDATQRESGVFQYIYQSINDFRNAYNTSIKRLHARNNSHAAVADLYVVFDKKKVISKLSSISTPATYEMYIQAFNELLASKSLVPISLKYTETPEIREFTSVSPADLYITVPPRTNVNGSKVHGKLPPQITGLTYIDGIEDKTNYYFTVTVLNQDEKSSKVRIRPRGNTYGIRISRVGGGFQGPDVSNQFAIAIVKRWLHNHPSVAKALPIIAYDNHKTNVQGLRSSRVIKTIDARYTKRLNLYPSKGLDSKTSVFVASADQSVLNIPGKSEEIVNDAIDAITQITNILKSKEGREESNGYDGLTEEEKESLRTTHPDHSIGVRLYLFAIILATSLKESSSRKNKQYSEIGEFYRLLTGSGYLPCLMYESKYSDIPVIDICISD